MTRKQRHSRNFIALLSALIIAFTMYTPFAAYAESNDQGQNTSEPTTQVSEQKADGEGTGGTDAQSDEGAAGGETVDEDADTETTEAGSEKGGDVLLPSKEQEAADVKEDTRAADDWGWGNYEHTVRWDKDGDVLTFTALETASTDKEKAITAVLDSDGNMTSGQFKNSIKEIRIKEPITGIGWTTIEHRNNYQPQWPEDYPSNNSSGRETRVFQDFQNLQTVVPCSTIKRIGWSAFRRCYKLENLDFSKMPALEEIMNQAFNPSGLIVADMSGCTSLKTIGYLSFSGSGGSGSHKLQTVVLPASVKTIGGRAFYACRKLENVTFMDASSVTTMYDWAFRGENQNVYNPFTYMSDEATTRRVAVRKALGDFFTGIENYPENYEAFWFTGIDKNEYTEGVLHYWPLEIEVQEKTTEYNGETQYGYEVSNLTEGGNNTCTVSGLKDGHVLSAPRYKPSSGKDKGEYTNGSFDNATYTMKYDGYDYAINYAVSPTPGDLKIEPKPLTIKAKSKEFTYNGTAQSCNEFEAPGLCGDDAISAVVTGSITFPSESPKTNVLESYEFTSGSADNYTITTENGELTMVNASRKITITAASQEWTYDGDPHQNTSVTVTSGELFPGDSLVAEAAGSVTDVDDTADGNNPVAEGYKIMHGDVDVTDNYVITPKAGKLTIKPKAVTVTAQDHEFTYDGTAHSWDKYDVDGLVKDDAITAVVTGGITFPSESPKVNELTSYEFTEGKASNYTVTTENGELTMVNASRKITITAASQEWTYDGDPHQNTSVTVTSGELFPGDSLVAEAAGSVTDVDDTADGNNPVAEGYKIMHGDVDVTDNYVITPKAGKLTIKPKAVTVTAQDHEFTYNGKAQSWDKYDVTGLVGSDAISAVVTGSITFPSESPKTNVLESYEFTSGDANNYTVTTANGELTMVNASKKITITAASQEWTYDGDPHQNTSVTVTSGELFPGDSLVAEAAGSVTDVDDTADGNNPVAEGYKIMHGDEDVTASYNITPVNGTLTIKPKAVTVTAQSKEFTYNGTAQSWDKYDVTGLVGRDAISAVVTGSITFPSESPKTNVLESYEFTSGDANNYTVTTANGELTMVNASNKITITAASQDWDYDGDTHDNAKVTVTLGELFPGDKLVAEATGSITYVRENADGNNLVAEGYKIMHGDEDVTDNYVITPEDGTLTINPVTLTITVIDQTYTYNGKQQGEGDTVYEDPEEIAEKVTVDGLVKNDALHSIVLDGEETEVGVYEGRIEAFQADVDNQDSYTIEYVNGTLTIEPAIVKVIYKLNGGTYNGSKKDIVEEYAVNDVIKIHAAPTRKGYKFLYWKGSKYHPGDSYKVPLGGHTFVAMWEKIPAGDDGSNTGGNSNTGDNMNLLGLIAAMTAAALGLFALIATRRRKDK